MGKLIVNYVDFVVVLFIGFDFGVGFVFGYYGDLYDWFLLV